MIVNLPCGCCKAVPLKSNPLRIRNELFKGNLVFFDNPFCKCCGIDEPEKFFLGHMFYLDGLVIAEKLFPLQGRTEEITWTLDEFKGELGLLIADEFEFSYIRAHISFNDNDNGITIRTMN